ncbi:hypothetical protein SCP_0206620 [Sparassis crispa]|uniref:Uncharacterized protein n=1 Tax=Sparassis crispa TaxID=139825 RepID=A0A401GBC5_9APHY|nr:hypothetical protein SCP_0206620 [Sparassis crispa]GBE79462.1 hypothetical protein SCP_0206620 [Sparassis crispa]
MVAYWDSYPNFDHNARAPLRTEFERLATQRGWRAGSRRYRNEWAQCCVTEFGRHYGHHDRLDGWQALCVEVGIRDVPTSITACKKILNRTWVNLVDLIDCRRTGQRVQRHRSRDALRQYSVDNDKIFPKKEAKRNGFLKVLLIQMF